MQCIYNPEVAKQGVLDVMAKMTALNTELTSVLSETNQVEVTADLFNSFYARYDDIPSYEIDWAVASIDPEEGHKLGAELRSQLQALTGVVGINKFIPARFVA